MLTKQDIRAAVSHIQQLYPEGWPDEVLDYILKNLLEQKARFPLYEFAATEMYKFILPAHRMHFMDVIINHAQLGSYVMAGKMLQLQLPENPAEALQLARKYLVQGDTWYVCDIIGERVMGHYLLTDPLQGIEALKENRSAESPWIRRSIGVAAHYAIKKKLDARYIPFVYELLFSLGNATDYHVKTGAGWGIKTLAKFHPGFIHQRYNEIFENPEIKSWFRYKVKIGLERAAYAARNTQ